MKHIKRCLLIANLFLLFICLFKVDEKVFSQEYIPSTNDEINIVYSQGDLPTGDPNIILFDEYKTTVFAFADQVEAFYNAAADKKLPEDEFDRNGYIAFWNEWKAIRYGI